MALVDIRNGSSLNSLSSTCFIRPKTTGLVSLFIQVVLIIVSGITSLFFFYHVGGYEYTHWNENSTILEPIHHTSNVYSVLNSNVQPSFAAIKSGGVNNVDDSLVSTAERKVDFSLIQTDMVRLL